MSEPRLAFTGGISTITIGGVVFDQLWVALVGLTLIVAGAAVIRLGWRRGQPVNGR